MASGHNKSGTGLRRKPGDWKNIAKGRDGNNRHARNVDPMTCAPNVGDVGSASYRRRTKVSRRP